MIDSTIKKFEKKLETLDRQTHRLLEQVRERVEASAFILGRIRDLNKLKEKK